MSKIEWCDITLNPITGKCPHGCEYCYMNDMRRRFPAVHKEAIESHPEVIEKAHKMRQPRTIFWGSAFDLFSDTVADWSIRQILETCVHDAKQHNHIFLTKNPKRYSVFAHYKKLGNIFFGASTTGSLAFSEREQAHIDFVSIEPFIDYDKDWMRIADKIKDASYTHIIIGGLTGRGNNPYKTTDYEAVVRLCKAAFECGKKVFVKNNLIKYVPLPVGIPYNIGAHVENFRELPWKLYTKDIMDGAK